MKTATIKFLWVMLFSIAVAACGGGGAGGGTTTTSDTAPPTVSSTSPANNATGAAINTAITATFSEAMDAPTLTTATLTLLNGTTPVSGTITYSGTTAIFTPLSNLVSAVTYTATVTTGAKDLAGNPMNSPYTWSFTTGAATGGGNQFGSGPDPVPDPTGNPTSYNLIDAAQTAGTITEEQALLYKLYVEFADPTLPAQYRGDDTGLIEVDGHQQVVAYIDRVGLAFCA